MNTILALSMLLSLPAMALTQHEEHQIDVSVGVHTLACITPATTSDVPASKRTITQLSEANGQPLTLIGEGLDNIIRPQSATMQGCNIAELDKISKEALMSFGFVKDEQAQLIIDRTNPQSTGGPCFYTHTQTIKIRLSKKVVLTSVEVQIVKTHPAECQN